MRTHDLEPNTEGQPMEPLMCSLGGIPFNKAHLDAKQARISQLEAENARLRQFVDFVNLWCNRKSKISDSERLSAIKFHPTAQAALR